MFFKKNKKKETEDPLVNNGPVDVIDLIAPAGIKIDSNYLQIGERYARTMFVFSFPQTLVTSWMSPLITLDQEMNISIFIYPKETSVVLKQLTKKSAQVQ